MNLPNKLTLLRAVLVPIFLLLLFLNIIPAHYTLALIVFASASITDALDGHLARKNNLITNFGKFLDPLADKVLVISALIAFTELEIISSIPVIIIVAREFMVSGLRLLAADSGKVVAAGFSGKLKTAFTMTAIIVILINLAITEDFNWFEIASANDFKQFADIIIQILIWVSAALTVISGCIYLKGYWNLIDSDK